MDEQILTVKEAAAFLKISERKLRQLVAGNQVPYKRIVGSIRFSKSTLVKWLNG